MVVKSDKRTKDGKPMERVVITDKNGRKRGVWRTAGVVTARLPYEAAYRTPGLLPQQRAAIMSSASDMALAVAGQTRKLNVFNILHKAGVVLGILPAPEIKPVKAHAHRKA